MQILTSIDGKQKFIYLIELYRELGIKTPYRVWIGKILDTEMENVDYWREYVNNKPMLETEFIEIETAKKIVLAENTERALIVYGQIRQQAPVKEMDFIKGGLFA